MSKAQVKFILTADGQSASLFWYQATIWDSQPIILSLLLKLSTDIFIFLVWCALSEERMDL
jgi:hypothetical protein